MVKFPCELVFILKPSFLEDELVDEFVLVRFDFAEGLVLDAVPAGQNRGCRAPCEGVRAAPELGGEPGCPCESPASSRCLSHTEQPFISQTRG